MHKDVRVSLYALCNGHDFILFHVSREDPVFEVKLTELPADLTPLARYLTPSAILSPHSVDFWGDLGIFQHIAGLTPENPFVLPGAHFEFIVKVDDKTYSIATGANIGGRDLLGSFDFDEQLYEQLLALLPETLAGEISSALKRQPYHFYFPDRPTTVTIWARIGTSILQNKDEYYIPFHIDRFE
jgi:hypothetical protein